MSANIVSEIFSYGFMQNAILVGLVLSIMLPVVGVIVYLRKIIFLLLKSGQANACPDFFHLPKNDSAPPLSSGEG